MALHRTGVRNALVFLVSYAIVMVVGRVMKPVPSVDATSGTEASAWSGGVWALIAGLGVVLAGIIIAATWQVGTWRSSDRGSAGRADSAAGADDFGD